MACSSTPTDEQRLSEISTRTAIFGFAVLPPDAGPSEIAQLELKLQLQQDFKAGLLLYKRASVCQRPY